MSIYVYNITRRLEKGSLSSLVILSQTHTRTEGGKQEGTTAGTLRTACAQVAPFYMFTRLNFVQERGRGCFPLHCRNRPSEGPRPSPHSDGVATNGTKGRYVRGSWHRYERSKDATCSSWPYYKPIRNPFAKGAGEQLGNKNGARTGI